MNPKKISLFFFVFLCLWLVACQPARKLPDVGDIPVQIRIERFDKALSSLTAHEVARANVAWGKQYGSFYADYLQFMLEAGDPQDTLRIEQNLNEILGQRDFKALSAAVERAYPDLGAQEAALTQAFKYVRYYFPAYQVPRFVSFFSGFAVQVTIGEGYIGIGLDMFLGADSEFYPALVKTIPRYLSRRFTPDYIGPRVLESVLRQDLFPKGDEAVNTLQNMVYEGKLLLALDSLLPLAADTLKIGYTAAQLNWAQTYQAEVWAWFLQEELLYSTDYLRIQRYFTEAPFTAELGENNESAPKLGTYMGWQIVRQYMERNPEISLSELLANQDAQQILEKSKFKGK